jgi:hypothetical protein
MNEGAWLRRALRILSHRASWLIEGVIHWEYAMTRDLMIRKPLNWDLYRSLLYIEVFVVHRVPCLSCTCANHLHRAWRMPHSTIELLKTLSHSADTVGVSRVSKT